MAAEKTHADSRDADRMRRALDGLCRLHGRHDSTESLLVGATQIVLDSFGVEYCAIVWRDGNTPTLRARASRHRDESINCAVFDDRIIAFLARELACDPAAGDRTTVYCGEAGADGSAQSVGRVRRVGRVRAAPKLQNALAAPLRVNGQIVGYLCATSGKRLGSGGAGFDHRLFAALGEHLGFAIETQNMRQLLASRYAAIALSRNGHGDPPDQSTLDAQFLAAVTEPEKVARIIARSFYKDLRKAGFETKQILVVATELIDSLNQALRRTKAKTASSAVAEAGAGIAPSFKAPR